MESEKAFNPLTLHLEEPVGLGFDYGAAGNSWRSVSPGKEILPNSETAKSL